MAARKFFVGGNWKMNGSFASNKAIVDTLNSAAFDYSKVEVVVAPPTIYLDSVRKSLRSEIQVSAQNCYHEKSGAFTGEISSEMLKDLGINWALQGHSERREYFKESDDFIAKKTAACISNGIKVIACIGEKLEEREKGITFDVVAKQMEPLAKSLAHADWQHVVVAYEPVWAIGTGKVATAAQAQEVHAFLRQWVSKNVSSSVAEQLRIIYGGSVNAKNCVELASCGDIDGFLVGGASLKPEFIDICSAKA